MTILDNIVAYKREEVALAKTNAPFSAIDTLARDTAPPRGFLRALERKGETGFALIAEIKKASPSKGLIRADFDPADLARAYESAGAACLSVLTDTPSFQGSPVFLREARDASRLPVLRKDFMIDPYQVAEARAWGADCILLIMACLTETQAGELEDAAIGYGLDVLVEVHTSEELTQALNLNSKLIGVNNRNLDDFTTNLNTTYELGRSIPSDCLIVSESGIAAHKDLITLHGFGARAFLVGESLMRQKDVASATRRLIDPSGLA